MSRDNGRQVYIGDGVRVHQYKVVEEQGSRVQLPHCVAQTGSAFTVASDCYHVHWGRLRTPLRGSGGGRAGLKCGESRRIEVKAGVVIRVGVGLGV